MLIKKTSETTPRMGSVVNVTNDSTEDTYSCDYVNNALEQKGEVLWTNIYDYNGFPSTQTGVSWGEYKWFKVFYYLDNHLSNIRSQTVNIGDVLSISESSGALTRQIGISSSLLYIHSGYYNGSQNNSAIIPSHIIGYK